MKKPLSRRLGETLAHIQDLFDTAVHLGFRRAKEAGDFAKKSEGKKVSGIGRVVTFFCEVGDSFYSKYSDIKSRGISNDRNSA